MSPRPSPADPTSAPPARRPRRTRASPPGAVAIGSLAMGSRGQQHPALGVGLWGLGRWEPDEERKTRAVAEHAAERGVPWFDTAEVYGAGRSERLLGDLLARWPEGRPRPFISTKLSWEHLRSAQVRASLIGSRRRLGVEAIDLYLVHAPDPRVPIRETMGALEALQKEGFVRALGVSNFSLEQLEAAEAALGEAEIVAHQVQFNLLEREEADPILDHCRRHRIVVEAYSPVARGLLAGRFLTGRGPSGPDRRRGHGVFAPEKFPEYRARARRIAELAEASGVPVLSLALHGLAREGAAPVFVASEPTQVDAALAAWAVRPSGKLLDRAVRLGRGEE